MERFGAKKWVVVISMGLTLGLLLLDETVVGLSLPTLQKKLHLNENLAHFVFSAPLIATACTIALFGRLSDFRGLRKGFLLGALLFTLGALGSTLSKTLLPLILCRSIQGLGMAFLFPTSISMATLVFPEHQRGLSIGVYGTVGTLFPPLSALAAGFILTHLNNPSLIFLMPLPILFLSTILLSLSYQTRSIHEVPEKSHLFDLYLFLKPAFSASILVLFTAQFVKLAIVVFCSKVLQNDLLLSPSQASLVLLPSLAIYPLVTTLSGALTDRFGPKRLMIAALTIVTLLFLFISATLPQKNTALLTSSLIAWAFATPFLFVSSMTEIMGSVSQYKRGEASGMGLTAQILGGFGAITLLNSFSGLSAGFSPIFLAAAIFTLLVTIVASALLRGAP